MVKIGPPTTRSNKLACFSIQRNGLRGGSPQREPKKQKRNPVRETSLNLVGKEVEPQSAMAIAFQKEGVVSSPKQSSNSLWIKQPVCMICKAECVGYYARAPGDNLGTCSPGCEEEKKKRETFIT